MKIITGPNNDKREIEIVLPEHHQRIGIMLSGGADSAILLYLLALEYNHLLQFLRSEFQ